MNFHVITIFPDAFDSYLKESIIGRAIKNKKIAIKFYNPRDYVSGKDWYKQVDDRPYGGGPGMVMQAEPILKAVSKIKKKGRASKDGARHDFAKSYEQKYRSNYWGYRTCCRGGRNLCIKE
jgi:tRNA (guanine37-N1)-methyltransferase